MDSLALFDFKRIASRHRKSLADASGCDKRATSKLTRRVATLMRYALPGAVQTTAHNGDVLRRYAGVIQ